MGLFFLQASSEKTLSSQSRPLSALGEGCAHGADGTTGLAWLRRNDPVCLQLHQDVHSLFAESGLCALTFVESPFAPRRSNLGRYQNDIAALTRPAGGADHTGARIRSCPSWAIDSETTHGHAKYAVHRGERGHRCSLGPHPRRPTILAKRGTTLRDRVSGDEAGQPESKVTRLGRSRHERH
jgi:hypothetical protein